MNPYVEGLLLVLLVLLAGVVAGVIASVWSDIRDPGRYSMDRRIEDNFEEYVAVSLFGWRDAK